MNSLEHRGRSYDTVPLKQNISANKNALISLHKTVYSISRDYPFKQQSEWFFEKKYPRLYFSIQSFYKINYLSSLSKHFYRNNIIYKSPPPPKRRKPETDSIFPWNVFTL
jgi:hypothetical protein